MGPQSGSRMNASSNHQAEKSEVMGPCITPDSFLSTNGAEAKASPLAATCSRKPVRSRLLDKYLRVPYFSRNYLLSI
jgi:hypothetical protein